MLAPVGLPTLPTLGLPEQGFDFLPEPRWVRDGVWFLGTGPSPEELRLRAPNNLNAADTTNTDQLWNGGGLNLNLNGSGLTVGVWDEAGVRGSHQEFGGRVTYGDNASFFSDHATHVAGTIAATGVSASARGMASQASIISYDWTSDMGELGNAPAAMVASNHSYGFLQGWARYNILGGGTEDTWFEDRALFTEERDFGKYSSDARSLDQVLVNRPNLLSVWSAGNDRDDAITSGGTSYVAYFSSGLGAAGYYRVNTSQYSAPASDGNGGTGYDSMEGNKNSKNSLTIGAINDATADPIVPGSVSTAGFSSYGPTDDGRIKPDLVANGVGLTSPLAGSNTQYGIYSGTSMAAPNATGTATLLIEHYRNLYGSIPRSATTKNLLIHTALDVGNFGPDFATGWGLIDAARAATTLTTAHSTSAAAMLQETTFTGTAKSFSFNALGDQPLKATIVWTDPAGNAHSASTLDEATAVLVNNLDLKITGPGGTYLPWTLSGSSPTALAVRNKANSVDNVEQVLIDNPTAGTYTITVTGPAATTQNFSIIVSQDQPEVTNDNQPPTVDLINKITSIREDANTSAGIKVADIVINDDNLGTNTLAIEGTNRELFELRNGTELWLVPGAVLNFESLPALNVTVEVDDDTIAGAPDDSESLAITIGDVNEAPTALALSANTVQENKAVGTSVGTFSTTDPDAGSTSFTYSLVAGDGASDNGSFTIDGGVLKTNASFDFETKPSYSIRVRTTDSGGLFFERAFTITVLDVNEAPTLLLQNTTSALLENRDTSARIKVGEIVIEDDALGSNSLSLTGADASLFEIENGLLYLSAGVALDHETKPTLNVTVAVDDSSVGSSPDDTSALAINIDNVNEAPTALALTSNTVNENLAAGTTVGTLSTTDPDAGDTFTYTLVAGTGDADNGSFTIEAGVLKTAASFDFESKSSYSIRVQSKDAGGLTKVAIFTITVNDLNEAPTALALSNNTVHENLASGTTVGTLSTTDPDAGDTFTYTLVAGTGDADNASFTIEAGVLKTAASFDFEAQSSYSIRVQTKDAGGLTKVAIFTITVNDLNEAPTDLLLSDNTVAESAAAGTVVGRFDTVDPDADGTFAYTLVSGTGSDDNTSFEIVEGVLKTVEELNFDLQSSFSIRVRTSDGGLSLEKVFAITVEDVNHAPTDLAISTASVDENLAAGTAVGSFSTTDADADETFTYTLVVGEGDDDNGAFEIINGVLQTLASFDFEAKSSYSIRVRTADSGGLTFAKAFTISINDINEAPTDLSLSGSSVNENMAAGATVGTFSATDHDAGDDLQYVLVSGEGDADNGSFEIVDGVLKTLDRFNYEAQNSYTIRVRTTDLGDLSTEQVFTITINDVNEAPVLDNSLNPKLTTTAEDAAIPAKTQVAALLARAVTDPDLGALRGIAVYGASNYHGLWQYSLDGGSTWIGVGSVSSTSALLLPGWAWVRFIPKPDFNGEVKLFYRAWDQTQGKPGERLNTQGNLGGDKSLSVAWESAQLTVSPVNDAPRLDNTLSPALKSIWEDAKAPAGTLVTDLVKGAISDVDQGAAQGIAVIGAGTSNGTWQYRLNGSTLWQGMGEIGESSALMLNADAGTRVRFIPASNFNGDVALYYRAWDRTEGQAGAKLSLIGKYGGTNAFSTAREGATLTVIPVNDRPVVKFSSTTGYQLNRAAITLAPNATVYDVDSLDFDGGWLRVHIGSGKSASNRLGIGAGFSVDASNNVWKSGTIIGTLNANGGQGTNDLIVSFKATASRAIVEELVRAITFKTVNGTAGQRTATFSLSDGDGGTSLDITKTINVI